MARCLFVVQGEGRGHMSQAIAMKEYLDRAGHSVEAVYLGGNAPEGVPGYFSKAFPGILHTFHSPGFLRTPNRKGIYVGRTLVYNLFRAFTYMREISRLRKAIGSLQPDVVINFYDVVGALALRKISSGIQRIGIGHHFFLHLEGYRCEGGLHWHRQLLKIHSRLVMQSCDRVLALSFREEQGNASMEVVPPLIREEFRTLKYTPGERYLVYLLSDGYLYDFLLMARSKPEFRADLFTSLEPGIELPPGISIHAFDAEKFRTFMAGCRGLITTAGFDTAAEAAYHGIPLAVIPARNHFEQRCNSADIERSGIGIAVRRIEAGILDGMQTSDMQEYRKWADRAGEYVLKWIEK